MGQQCSSLCGQAEDKYTRNSELTSAAAHHAPRQQAIVTSGPKSSKEKQQAREAGWRSTGIVGLRDQGLKELPSSVASVGSDAKVLDASNNKLRELPLELSQLVNLQRLVLTNNSFVSLPGPVLVCLVNLKLVNLDNNQLTSLPEELGQLLKLERLTVNNNALTHLPDLTNLPRLQFVSAANNRLTQVPENLPTEVEEVDVSSNQIQSISVSVSRLLKLKILNLDNNQIKDVPSEVLLHCVALNTLSLHGCPIKPDVLQANPAFDTFEKRRREKYDKVIAGGVLMGSRGMDEGVDRLVQRG